MSYPLTTASRRLFTASLLGATALTVPGCIVVVGNTSRPASYESSSWDASGSPAKRIGIETEQPGPALAAQLGVQPDQTALITRVVPGSSAEAAGFKRFDVLTHIDGQPGATIWTVRSAVQSKDIGQTVAIRVLRAGQPVELVVTVERTPVPTE